MLKKTIPILSVVAAAVMLLIAAKALTNLQEQNNSQTAAIDVDSIKQQVIAFISQNKQLEAQAAINKLYLDFADNPKLASAVYDISESYRNNSKFEQALAFYKDVIAKWPASEQAMWAQRGIAISYVALGKLTEAQADLEKLKAGFSTEPNIAEAVFNVGDAYYWFGKFKEADGVYKYVTENYPKSDFGMWSQMGLAISGIAEANDVAAETAVEGLIGNYKDNAKLPEALYYIGTKYGYDRKYEKAKGIYQAIIDGWSEDQWAKNAKFETAKIGVFKYLDKNDEPNTLSAIDALITDFKDRGDLSAVVFDMAARSDWQSKYEPNDLTKNIYKKVIENFPHNTHSCTAKLKMAKLEIISKIEKGDDTTVIYDIDLLIEDFNNHSEIHNALYEIGGIYSIEAYSKLNKGDVSKGQELYGKALSIYEKIIYKLPVSVFYTPRAYHSIGSNYRQQGKNELAVEYLEKVSENYPSYDLLWDVYLNLAKCYSELEKSGKISHDIAAHKITQSCEKVISGSSNYAVIKTARLIADNYKN